MSSSIFNSVLENGTTLFADKTAIQTQNCGFEPTHRQPQVQQITASISVAATNNAQDVGKPDNILITGPPGTGKTTTVLYVLHQLEQHNPNHVECTYLDCRNIQSYYRLITAITQHYDRATPDTGLSTKAILDKLCQALTSQPKSHILILDNVHKLGGTAPDRLNELASINNNVSTGTFSIICITTEDKFAQRINLYVKDHIFQQIIPFDAYDANQISDIIKNAALMAVPATLIGDGVIEHCAAITAQNGKDPRKALDIFRRAVELAERQGDRKISSEHVISAASPVQMEIKHDTP